MDKIFDPFFTTKPWARDGLAPTVYGIVSSRRLIASASKPRGAAFRIFLPCTSRRLVAAARRRAPNARAPTSPAPRILFVEDEDAVAGWRPSCCAPRL